MNSRSKRFLTRLVLTAIFAAFALPAVAGGPHYIAGVTYFNQGTAGTPLTWSQGAVNYYTDQGDLSPIMPGPAADALVADAFSQWTSISTAAIAANHGGQLAEDVNGSNVYRNSDGSITMPADIQPTAVGTPVGVVYDYDGAVTDALLGQGASGDCVDNGSYGGLDNFAASANFLHALVVLNGSCVVSQNQQPDLEYHLVRVLGRILGLDWSQTNLNVITGKPHPTADDYAGFTIMHSSDPINCVPVTLCYPNPYIPKMDDQAALSRLYPVTSQNIGNFTGKQLFSANTGRIHGSVYFSNAGQDGQGMQGVNVVARWIDPNTGQPSRAYVATSVSGFLFSGNIGNIATGYYDPAGVLFNQWGSNDATVEGFFDLAGLQIPNGQNSTQYQLTVEPLDPTWSGPVGPYGIGQRLYYPLTGPYGPGQVQPSGATQPIVVNVSLGNDTGQDILMQGNVPQKANWFGPTTYASPAPVPVTGDWAGALSPYGDLDYFWFSGQTNRTLAVMVTALDDFGNPSEGKSQPVVGMWDLSDPGESPAPANTPSAFNSPVFGMTMLNAQLLTTTGFRIGISDIRGDGRPDYRYRARVLYGDHVTPTRASVAGGTPLAVAGLGFQNNAQVTVASINSSPVAFAAGQIFVAAPPQPDGLQNISIIDPPTSASSVMTGVLTYGAGPNDLLKLLAGANPGTPVGAQAPEPIRVQVVASDGVTPVNGASIFFTATPAVAFSACSGGSNCTVLTDETGQASTYVTPLSSGVITITAQLAPASYTNPQQVQATLLGTETSLDIGLVPQYSWVAQGAAENVPLTARVLSDGNPVSGRTVNFYLEKGSGTLNPPSAVTNSNGYASSTLEIPTISGDEQVAACVEPGDAPCQTFYGTAVPASAQQLQPISGDVQLLVVGQSLQPITVRVTDGSSHPVLGASVLFQAVIGRVEDDVPIIPVGDPNINGNPTPIILGSWQSTAVSNVNGLATVQPSTGGFPGAVAILGNATAGTAQVPFELQLLPPP